MTPQSSPAHACRPSRGGFATTAAVATALLVAIAALPAHAQAGTTLEVGIGTYVTRTVDGWSGRLGLLGHVAARRKIAGAVAARVGAMAMHRPGGDDGALPRVRAAGGTAELVWDGPSGTPLFLSTGMGVFAVQRTSTAVNDPYQRTFGSFGVMGTIGSRYPIGTRTLEVRLGVMWGDLGAGVRTVTLGVVVTP